MLDPRLAMAARLAPSATRIRRSELVDDVTRVLPISLLNAR